MTISPPTAAGPRRGEGGADQAAQATWVMVMSSTQLSSLMSAEGARGKKRCGRKGLRKGGMKRPFEDK